MFPSHDLPDEMRKMNFKTGLPEIVRTEKDWLSYDSDTAKSSLYAKTRLRPTGKQIDQALETMDWLRAFIKQKPESKRKLWAQIIFVKSAGRGFRLVADIIEFRTGKRISKSTVKNRFDEAVGWIKSHANQYRDHYHARNHKNLLSKEKTIQFSC